MRIKKVSGILLAAIIMAGSSFTVLAAPATYVGTMPNDIEIKNGDGTAPTQIALLEAIGTAFIEYEYDKQDLASGAYWYSAENTWRPKQDAPAYRVHEDAVFIMPADGFYTLSIVGEAYVGVNNETYIAPVSAKKGDVIPLVYKGIKLPAGGDMSSYLYQIGLISDTGDRGWSGMSAWQYRVSNDTAQSDTPAQTPSATWAQDAKGWWIQHSDGSYLTNTWYQNTDGVWYYMGADGYMLTNTTAPDGCKVGADGAWLQ